MVRNLYYAPDMQFLNTGHAELRCYPLCNAILNELFYGYTVLKYIRKCS